VGDRFSDVRCVGTENVCQPASGLKCCGLANWLHAAEVHPNRLDGIEKTANIDSADADRMEREPDANRHHGEEELIPDPHQASDRLVLILFRFDQHQTRRAMNSVEIPDQILQIGSEDSPALGPEAPDYGGIAAAGDHEFVIVVRQQTEHGTVPRGRKALQPFSVRQRFSGTPRQTAHQQEQSRHGANDN
jgi:hypothetical protein